MIELLLQHGVYAGLFVVLVGCAVGVPLPEEATFVAAGYIGARSGANVWVLCGVGLAGIVFGDLIPFLLGRYHALRLLKFPLIARAMTPSRIDRVHQWFRRRGAKTVFLARFVPGLRTAAFFLAGASRMRIARFMLWDGLGALLTCPISIWLAYTYGEDAREWLHRSQLACWLLVSSAAFGFFLWYWWRRRFGNRRADAQPGMTPPKRPADGLTEPCASEKSEP